MLYSKKQLIEKALIHPDVLKCIEGIVRTVPRSKQRGVMVDAFVFKFCQIATELFKENIGGSQFGEDLIFKARITFSGKQEFLSTTGLNDKILTILCDSENFRFKIGTENSSYLIVKEFGVEEIKTSLTLSVFFTGVEEIDNFIIKIIDSLRKR